MPTPVVHFEIGCPDKDESRAFYETVFGWKSEGYGPFSYRFDTGSPRGIQGFTTALGHEPHRYVMVYVEVDDIPAHLAKAEAHGGKTMVPETEVPGMGWFAWLTDPAGNRVGLWKPAPVGS